MVESETTSVKKDYKKPKAADVAFTDNPEYFRASSQYRKYRRTWWWEEMQWNARHSVSKSSV